MRLVLVHSPLLGPSSWRPVSAALADAGHHTIVPSLTKALGASIIWEAQVAAVAEAASDHPVALVAHSGAGPLLPAIADQVDASHAVFVDAALPHPGLSRLAALPDAFSRRLASLTENGSLPVWTEWFAEATVHRLVEDPAVWELLTADLPRVPARLFDEPLPDLGLPGTVRPSYVQLSEAYAAEGAQAASRGWPSLRHDGDHLWPLTHPVEVAGAIVSVTR